MDLPKPFAFQSWLFGEGPISITAGTMFARHIVTAPLRSVTEDRQQSGERPKAFRYEGAGPAQCGIPCHQAANSGDDSILSLYVARNDMLRSFLQFTFAALLRPAMKVFFASLLVVLTHVSLAQKPINGNAIPAAVYAAKTVAVVNDTHTDAVGEGAVDALKAWGHFTVVDDPDTADVTLRFDKTKEHSGQDSQKPDPNTGQTSYSYGMTFGSSIHMKAYLKDGDSPFYTTKTDESKKKAGTACVSDFRSALQAARTR